MKTSPLKIHALTLGLSLLAVVGFGAHPSSRLPGARNFNIPALVDQTNWPRGKPDGVTPEWRHSDMREVAYLYQYGVFDKIIAISKP